MSLEHDCGPNPRVPDDVRDGPFESVPRPGVECSLLGVEIRRFVEPHHAANVAQELHSLHLIEILNVLDTSRRKLCPFTVLGLCPQGDSKLLDRRLLRSQPSLSRVLADLDSQIKKRGDDADGAKELRDRCNGFSVHFGNASSGDHSLIPNDAAIRFIPLRQTCDALSGPNAPTESLPGWKPSVFRTSRPGL